MDTKREELLKKISSSKKYKFVSLIISVIGILSYVYFGDQQKDAERELMILDNGKLDQVVLE